MSEPSDHNDNPSYMFHNPSTDTGEVPDDVQHPFPQTHESHPLTNSSHSHTLYAPTAESQSLATPSEQSNTGGQVDLSANDDDDMPALQSISDFSDSEMDARMDFAREIDAVNHSAPPPLADPHSASTRTSRRRARVEDAEDEDDVRPSRRQRLNEAGASTSAVHRDPSAEVPRATAPRVAPNDVPHRGPGGVGMVFTFDEAGNPIASFPFGDDPSDVLNENQVPLHRPPFFGNGNPGGPSLEDRESLLGNLQAFVRTMNGLFMGEEERDDPDRARKLIAGLEEVPYGLVRRMERIGGASGEDASTTSDTPSCAICWESLLDEQGGFAVPDSGSNTIVDGNSRGDMADEGPTTGVVGLTRPPRPASGEPLPSGTGSKRPTIITLPCSHTFHASCLIPWFARPKHTTCPTCRFNVDPDNLTRRTRASPSRATPADPLTGPVEVGSDRSAPPRAASAPPGVTHGPVDPPIGNIVPVNTDAHVDVPNEAPLGNNPSPPGMNNGFFVDVSFSVEPIPLPAGHPLRPNLAPTAVPGDTNPDAAPATESDATNANAARAPPLNADMRGILTQIVSRALAQSFAAALGGVASNGTPPTRGDRGAGVPTHPNPLAGSGPGVESLTPNISTPQIGNNRVPFGPPPPSINTATNPGTPPVIFGPFTFNGGGDIPLGFNPPPSDDTRNRQDRGPQGIQFAFPLNIPLGFPLGGVAPSEGVPSATPSREWAPPPAPGPTLRQRIEKRERELGLRCWDISCGVGPSDEDPTPSIALGGNQIAVCATHDGTPVCEHRFHPACLVVSERIAGGEHINDPGSEVFVSCAVCRASGSVTRAQWDEGVRALAN